MHRPRTQDLPTAHEESEVEDATVSDVMHSHTTSGPPSRRRVSTTEFIAALERDEVERRREELASRVLLPAAEFRARLHMSPQALSRAVKAKRIYFLRGQSDEPVYPAFFTTLSPGRAAIERVCMTLGDMPGGSKHFFLISRRTSLGNMSPLQALASCKEDEVIAAAEAFREG